MIYRFSFKNESKRSYILFLFPSWKKKSVCEVIYGLAVFVCLFLRAKPMYIYFSGFEKHRKSIKWGGHSITPVSSRPT